MPIKQLQIRHPFPEHYQTILAELKKMVPALKKDLRLERQSDGTAMTVLLFADLLQVLTEEHKDLDDAHSMLHITLDSLQEFHDMYFVHQEPPPTSPKVDPSTTSALSVPNFSKLDNN